MQAAALRGVFGGAPAGDWSGLSVLALLPALPGIAPVLAAGSAAAGTWQRLALAEGAAAAWLGTTAVNGLAQAGLADAATLAWGGQTRLLGIGRSAGSIDTQVLGPDGALTRVAPLRAPEGLDLRGTTALAGVTLGTTSYVAAAARDGDRLALIEIGAGWRPAGVSITVDGPKTALGGVSDLVSLTTPGGATFVVAGSGREAGLAAYRIDPGGTLTLTDAMTAKDGLWIAGVDRLATLALDGTAYILAASTLASTLAVLRINEMGVLFVTDQVQDTLATRFHRVAALATVEAQGRPLVLAAGSDGGFSLFELLPGGRLFHHRAYPAEAGWGLTQVGGLAAAVVGGEIQVFLANGAGPGLAQLAIPLAALGPRLAGGPGPDRLTGTAGADLMIGGAGNDTLEGGPGDDVLVAGTGRDLLIGGQGADVFVLTADAELPGGGADTIRGFEKGIDRIDLSGWGMLYHVSALDLRARPGGAEICFRGEAVVIESAAGTPIDPAAWTQDDFLF